MLAAILAASWVAVPAGWTSAPAIQWPFDPSGFLYPLAGQAGDVDHITLMRNYREGDERQPPGLTTATGEFFRFVSLNTGPTPGLGKILLEFATETRHDVSYQFSGEFHNSHIYEIYVTDPNEVVASGTFRTLQGGKVVSEAQVQFTYSALVRNSPPEVNVRYPSGKTELIRAVSQGDLARVRDLLARGAKVNARGPYGSAALEVAVRLFRGSEELVEALIHAGADVNLANDSGETPLMAATYSGARLVELLLEAGAKVNVRSKDGRTALFHAVQAVGVGLGSVENVKVLLGKGAEVNVRDALGRTALSIAEENRSLEVMNLLKQACGK